MTRYIIRRLILLVPVLIGVTFLVFLITNLAPGDPVITMLGPEYTPEMAAQLREELGLDRPLVEQYLKWLGRAARLDLGKDLITRLSVADQLKARFSTTLLLSLATMVIAVLIGIPIGVLSATKPNSLIDNVGRLLAMIGVSMPVFWLGMLFIIAFAVQIRIFRRAAALRSMGPLPW